jgi:predicted dehydrogenase
MAEISVAVIGVGNRGYGFAKAIRASGLGKIVAVAEPRAITRAAFAKDFGLAPENVFSSWQELTAKAKLCDAVVIATMDQDHVEPAEACFAKGYHVLLEKPMATSLEDCKRIERAHSKAGSIAAVCHSLRYHAGFFKLKELAESGVIGELVSMDQLEQITYWHFAHSYVRGNWGNEARSSFMLMAKSCHDVDYMSYLMGKDCEKVSSFGSLQYFNAAHAPKGATARCTDGCPVEKDCLYSSLKVYVDVEKRDDWLSGACAEEHDRESHLKAVQTGPYGRCVWKTDNDVVDHQVLALQYAGGATGTLTTTAFCADAGRKVRLHGTLGEMFFDEHLNEILLKVYGKAPETIALAHESGGHGGGDERVVKSWLMAIQKNDPALIRTTPQESLKTHTIVFAAEASRKEGKTMSLKEQPWASAAAGKG